MNISGDDTLDMLKDFLPQIQQQLRKQMLPQIQEFYDNKIRQQLQKIQKQAQQQYEQALQTLHNEFLQLKNEKEHELQIELIKNQQSFHEKERIRIQQAQQKFLQEHFDDKILNHPKILQIEQNLQTQILELMLDKYEILRDKRIKQLRIRLENKEQKQRSECQKRMKSDIYSKSGLQQLKKQISQFKVYLASMKSKYNIKINKINSQIKDIQKKCQEIQYKNSDFILQQLQKQINSITQDRIKRQQLNAKNQQSKQIINESSYCFQKDQNVTLGDNLTKYKPYNMINQSTGKTFGFIDAKYINQDINMQSDSSFDDDENSRESNNLPPPPLSHAQMLNKLLTDEHQHQIQRQQRLQTQQIYLERPIQPLLNLNVAKMLRQQWYEDSFDKFISMRNEKQNNMNLSNKPLNNFQTIYEQHLKKLNKQSKLPKTKKLTQKAKNKLLFQFNKEFSRSHAYDF